MQLDEGATQTISPILTLFLLAVLLGLGYALYVASNPQITGTPTNRATMVRTTGGPITQSRYRRRSLVRLYSGAHSWER